MNPPSSTDHFAEAQRLLAVDAEDWTNAERLARAQVHATLALVSELHDRRGKPPAPTARHSASPETAARVLDFLEGISLEGVAEASIREIADSLGIGRSTAHRALSRLESEGDIVVVLRGTGDQYPSSWLLRRHRG